MSASPNTGKIRRLIPHKMLKKPNIQTFLWEPQKYHQPVYIDDC
jgi:hypothetical protein